MSWIKPVPYAEARGRLKTLYDRIKGPGGYIDNILTIHGLRPHSLEGHMALYKNVLHHHGNKLEKWRLELLGVYVSALNGCDYCVNHHFAGLKTLLRDDEKANAMLAAVRVRDFSNIVQAGVIDKGQSTLLDYAHALTKAPADMSAASVEAMRAQGFDDGEILEVNQVVAYFNYANRTVLGLGVSNDGEVLGLSPGDNDDPDDWRHDEAKS
ncbi:MAG: alkyl hydroperoxide reductase AhpD [Hyphococcus sp.]|nr:MAG: alkyl hydroperoxide reductase AhpD [Marinicaulis sp.]